MRQFTSEEIQARFEQLPKELQDAITSAEVHNSLISISKKHDLLLDQEGELVDQVGLVMLGLSPSKDFVRNFSNIAGIDQTTASAIAEDINKEIFSEIKASMQAFQQKEMIGGNVPENLPTEESANKQALSSLEQAGNFKVESNDWALDHGVEHVEKPEDVIAGIENPTPSVEPDMSKPAKPEIHTDLLVDHLLSGPIVTTEKKVEQKTPIVSPKLQTPEPSTKPKGPDLYREPIE